MAPSTPAAPAFDESTAGTLRGTVSFAGADDPDKRIRMDADPVCAGLHSEPAYTETVVGTGGNVFVYVKSGLESYSFQAPDDPVYIRQEGCIYQPHVLGLMVGQTLKVINGDPTLHNVHATPRLNPEFNTAQPIQNQELEKTFNKVEIMVPFKCDVHPWMTTYVGVLNHPYYAVSAEDGSFTIDKLPPGTYTVEAWHETFGTQTQEVTIEANGEANLEFSFAPAA